jgi:penicillin amidase
VRTPGIEGCAQQASTALADAVARLSTAYGADPTRWRWGRAHRAHSSHPVFTGTPLRPLFDLSIANGGGAFTVDAARFDMTDDAHPFRQTAGPGFRAVYDLSRLDGGWAIQSTGQSGNPLSRHYRDFVRRWRDGQSVPLSLRREDAERGAIGTLVLAPAAP